MSEKMPENNEGSEIETISTEKLIDFLSQDKDLQKELFGRLLLVGGGALEEQILQKNIQQVREKGLTSEQALKIMDKMGMEPVPAEVLKKLLAKNGDEHFEDILNIPEK